MMCQGDIRQVVIVELSVLFSRDVISYGFSLGQEAPFSRRTATQIQDTCTGVRATEWLERSYRKANATVNVSLRFNKGPDIRDSRPAGNRMGQDNQKTAAFRLKQPKRPFQHEIVRTLLWPALAQFVSLQCTGFLIRKVKRRIHQNDIESRQLSAFDISEITRWPSVFTKMSSLMESPV